MRLLCKKKQLNMREWMARFAIISNKTFVASVPAGPCLTALHTEMFRTVSVFIIIIVRRCDIFPSLH